MTIDTRIKGDAAAVEALGQWFKGPLAEKVSTSVDSVYHAKRDTEADWGGPAAEAFRGRMASGGKKADDVAGLTVTKEGIADPGAGPAQPSDPGPRATPQQATQYSAAYQTYQAHAKKVAAYAQAKKDVKKTREDLNVAELALKNSWDELAGKPVFAAVAFADATIVASVSKAQVRKYEYRAMSLRGAATRLARENPTDGTAFRGQPFSDQGRRLHTQRQLHNHASAAERRAMRAARFGGKIPVIGAGFAALSAAYDIEHGKSPSKAITSAVISQGGGTIAGAMAGRPGRWAPWGGRRWPGGHRRRRCQRSGERRDLGQSHAEGRREVGGRQAEGRLGQVRR